MIAPAMLLWSHSCNFGLVLNAVIARRDIRSAVKCFGNANANCGFNLSMKLPKTVIGFSFLPSVASFKALIDMVLSYGLIKKGRAPGFVVVHVLIYASISSCEFSA